jgi:hypothetical protein
MSLSPGLEKHLAKLVQPRGVEDATRLIARVGHFISLNLAAEEVDRDALDLAAWALQLPALAQKPSGRAGPPSLKERAEQAAELLLNLPGSPQPEEELLDRAAAVLRDLPRKTPESAEARLLADAVNLEDFGLLGLVLSAMHFGRANAPLSHVVDGFHKRTAYGYWDVRLKDGFHHRHVRELARRRLEEARKAVAGLEAELP